MKAVIRLDYKTYVLDSEKALHILQLLEGAEIYEQKWHSKTDTQESFYTHHIYADDPQKARHLELMTDETYRLYKLAGKPE